MSQFDAIKIRQDFPVLDQTVNGKPVVFLDTAASAQKPRAVINAMNAVMEGHYANIHRGLYEFSQKTTTLYEKARQTVAGFLSAGEEEIVFTRNATESINLVAATWGRQNIDEGDEILITHLEHHANIVPWQMLAKEKNAKLVVVPVTDKGEVDQEAFENLLTPRTKIVAVSHMSNALGTISPVKDMTEKAHKLGAVVLLDGAQAVMHVPVNVKDLSCDFYVFSGHKLYGPSGIGVLYGRGDVMKDMPPYQGGGDMIDVVSFDGTTFKAPPARFEAGTPAIVEAVGLAAAIDYLQSLGGIARIAQYEEELYKDALRKLQNIDGITLYGQALRRASVLSFTADWGHPSDIATLLDKQGVAVRAGHHCAMPLMERFGITGTVRASLGLYSTSDDVDALIEALNKARDMLGG